MDSYDPAFSNADTWYWVGAFGLVIILLVMLLAARGLLTDDMDD